jgi:hypothetical protein
MVEERRGEIVMSRVAGLTVVVAALVLGACSASDNSGETTTSTAAPATTSTVQTQASTTSVESVPSATRILFVGNSLTFYEGGLQSQMTELAASATPPPLVETEESTLEGGTLETLWKYTSTPEMIASGDYDIVVLQGWVAESGSDSFQENVGEFVEATRATGAEPILFMEWPAEIDGRATMDDIALAHSDIAAELDVDVAPVGLAFQQASEERPEIDLLASDRDHQSKHGAYLAVNVIYLTIFGTEHSVTLAYLPEGITEEEATFLQRIAQETVRNYAADQTS